MAKIPATLNYVRYMELTTELDAGRDYKSHVFHHREIMDCGECWTELEGDEVETMFEQGGTPRIVPIGKWNWEKK